MKIYSNTIVYNEENFVWFAIESIINFVDKAIIYDTGSTDSTVEIINDLKKKYPEKIIFSEEGKADGKRFSTLRQKMLDQSDCDWIIVLDGDEIWPRSSIEKLTTLIKNEGQKLNAIYVPFYNLVGDVYHFQKETKGKYNIQGKEGHLSVRAINKKIPGLHIAQEYPHEGFFTRDNKPIQELQRLQFLESKYFHASILKRSNLDRQRIIKYDMGVSKDDGIMLPEVFFEKFPDYINNPLKKRSLNYIFMSFCFDFLREIKNIFG